MCRATDGCVSRIPVQGLLWPLEHPLEWEWGVGSGEWRGVLISKTCEVKPTDPMHPFRHARRYARPLLFRNACSTNSSLS